jgi:hypothetical protein
VLDEVPGHVRQAQATLCDSRQPGTGPALAPLVTAIGCLLVGLLA